MAWYPGATKMELQPESDAQPAIRPTQLIVHSLAAPWTARRTYEYWRDSTSLESHFGLGYTGDLAQYIGTETRADANAGANLRPDGTGAVSVETASNAAASDLWTPEQVEQLIRVGAWMHEHHGLPLRICRTHDDPGYGWHRQFPQWNPDAHSCPGDARVRQFQDVVFPGIVARATEEEPMALSATDIDKIAVAVLKRDGIITVPGAPATNPTWTLSSTTTEILKRVDQLAARLDAQGVTIRELAAALAAHDEQVDADALVARIEAAIEGITVRLDVGTA